jgi:hypothetical protein
MIYFWVRAKGVVTHRFFRLEDALLFAKMLRVKDTPDVMVGADF